MQNFVSFVSFAVLLVHSKLMGTSKRDIFFDTKAGRIPVCSGCIDDCRRVADYFQVFVIEGLVLDILCGLQYCVRSM